MTKSPAMTTTNPADPRYAKVFAYLDDHHVLTLAAAHDGDLWCASCFYVFSEEQRSFFIMTEDSTRHAKLMLAQPRISGTVADQTANVAKIRGFQFSATSRQLEGAERSAAKGLYCRRFPIALAARAPIWRLQIDYGKFTDNTLGFGTKIILDDNTSNN